MRVSRMIAGVILALPLPAAAQADNAVVSQSQRFVVGYEAELEPLAINRMHRWVIHVERRDGTPVDDATISLVGGMPDHDHGLPTLPQATRYLGDGDYQVEGMKFHMNGRWVITVTIVVDGEPDTAVFELRL